MVFSCLCAAAIVRRNHFFRLHQQNKSPESKVKFRKASNYCKRVLKAAKSAYESITFQRLGSRDFWQIGNSALNKGKSAIPPLFNYPKVLPSASGKAKLFAENFSKKSNLNDSGISLPVFPSRTNMKLHNISVNPTIVKKVITNLDLSKTSDPDCIPVVVPQNCELELSYIFAELFSECLVFQIVGRFHQWSLYLRMLGKGLELKTTTQLVFFLWLVLGLFIT